MVKTKGEIRYRAILCACTDIKYSIHAEKFASGNNPLSRFITPPSCLK